MGGIKSNIIKINALYNKSIKSALGLAKNTPSHIVYSEAGVLPFKSQIEQLTIKDICKSLSLNNENKNIVQNYLKLESRFKRYKSYMQEIIFKYKDNINSMLSRDDLNWNFTYLEIKKTILEEWENEYMFISQDKGRNYFNYNTRPRNSSVKFSKTFTNYEAKILFRLRAGYPIKLDTDTYYCNICNMKNDIRHKIFICKQQEDKRRNLMANKQWPTEDLNKWNYNNYVTIINFVKTNNIVI